MKVTIKGGKELDAALKQFSKATGTNIMRRALRAGADPMAADARDRAPEKTGVLKGSIQVSNRVGGSKASLQRQQAAIARRTGGEVVGQDRKDFVEIHIGIDQNQTNNVKLYSIFQELGTEDTPPVGYMRGAWDAGKGKAIDDVVDALKPEIEAAAGRAARKTARASK